MFKMIEKILKRDYVPKTENTVEMTEIINRYVEYARNEYSSLIIRVSTLNDTEKHMVDRCLELIINKNELIRYYENVIYKQILIKNCDKLKEMNMNELVDSLFGEEVVING